MSRLQQATEAASGGPTRGELSRSESPQATAPVVEVCGGCGEAFPCSASSAPCWCEQIEPTAEIRASLRERFADCLCPLCLSRASAAPGAAVPE